jgi:lysozyme family protein
LQEHDMNFDEAFTRLLGHEGGYTIGVGDPGGETKFGVSKRAYPDLDIKALTVDGAKAIYRRDYWDATRCDELPDSVRFTVFDAAVNSGVTQAIKWLQATVGTAEDGKIGPITLKAVEGCPNLLAKYSGRRLQFMSALSNWPRFGRGWANRIAQNLMEA